MPRLSLLLTVIAFFAVFFASSHVAADKSKIKTFVGKNPWLTKRVDCACTKPDGEIVKKHAMCPYPWDITNKKACCRKEHRKMNCTFSKFSPPPPPSRPSLATVGNCTQDSDCRWVGGPSLACCNKKNTCVYTYMCAYS